MREKHIQVVFVGPVLLSLPKSLACPSAQPGRAHLLLLWLPFLQIVQLAKRKTTSQATYSVQYEYKNFDTIHLDCDSSFLGEYVFLPPRECS